MILKDWIKLLITLLAKIFSNPSCFFLYFLLFPTDGFLPTESTNVSKIHLLYYISFSIGYSTLMMLLFRIVNGILNPEDHWGIQFLNKFINLNVFTFVSWALTFFILDIYQTGMEGNIMGFIGFPIIIIALGFQFASHYRWLSNEFFPNIENRLLPLAKKFAQLPFYQKFLMSVILNPMTLFLFEFTNKKENLIKANLDLVLSYLSAVIVLSLSLIVWISILWFEQSNFRCKTDFALFFDQYISNFHAWKCNTLILTFVMLILIMFFRFNSLTFHDLISILLFLSFFSATISSIKTVQSVFGTNFNS